MGEDKPRDPTAALYDIADELEEQTRYLKKINLAVQVWFWLTVVIPAILLCLGGLAWLGLLGAILGE